MTAISELFAERVNNWSDIQDHLVFLSTTAAAYGTGAVVELGARSGNSTLALLTGVEIAGGHLHSVDADTPDWPRDVWEHPQLTFVPGDDLTVRDQVPDEIDVLFIDTSHEYHHTLAELRLYGESAKVILLHDTDLEYPHGAPLTIRYPVRIAMIDWCNENGRQWYERPGSYGMGVIGL